jgi:hypothetical protein
MKISQRLTNAVRSLAEQINAHTGQPCAITLQPGDTSDGQYWEVFSNDVAILLYALEEETLYAQIKVYSQGYAAASATQSKEQA